MKLQSTAPANFTISVLNLSVCSKADFTSANPSAKCHCWEPLAEHLRLTGFTSAVKEMGNSSCNAPNIGDPLHCDPLLNRE